MTNTISKERRVGALVIESKVLSVITPWDLLPMKDFCIEFIVSNPGLGFDPANQHLAISVEKPQ